MAGFAAAMLTFLGVLAVGPDWPAWAPWLLIGVNAFVASQVVGRLQGG